jgi:hypothetical protein
MPSDRTALLIIRAWIEEGSAEPLRAQVRLTADVASGFEATSTLADADAICAMVRAWLADLSAEAQPPGRATTR